MSVEAVPASLGSAEALRSPSRHHVNALTDGNAPFRMRVPPSGAMAKSAGSSFRSSEALGPQAGKSGGSFEFER